MQKGIFAGRLRGLLPAPDEATTTRWLYWADQCAEFNQEHRHNTDAMLRLTPESILEEFHAGLFLASQRYGAENAQKVYELIRDHALYAHELIGAAAFFYGGGTPEEAVQRSIDEMFESGELMGPSLRQMELRGESLKADITEWFDTILKSYPIDIVNAVASLSTCCSIYKVVENAHDHFFISSVGQLPATVLCMAATAVRTQGITFTQALNDLDRRGNYIPGLPSQLRLMEYLTPSTAEWLLDGFGYNPQVGQYVVFDFDHWIFSMEFSGEVFPQCRHTQQHVQSFLLTEAVFKLASPVLYAIPPSQVSPHRHALYTVLEDGVTRYLGGDAGCMLPFQALHAVGEYRSSYETATDTLEHLTPAALPFYQPDVNAGPVFYPVTSDRAARLLDQFGATNETAMLVHMDLDGGMIRIEHNVFCYPEGQPCDFSISIDEGHCCLQEVIDEAADMDEADPRSLEALILDKIESSLRQNEQDGITEVSPCS